MFFERGLLTRLELVLALGSVHIVASVHLNLTRGLALGIDAANLAALFLAMVPDLGRNNVRFPVPALVAQKKVVRVEEGSSVFFLHMLNGGLLAILNFILRYGCVCVEALVHHHLALRLAE